MRPEREPQPRLEHQVLTRLGYGHRVDVPIDGFGEGITGSNFLDAYQNPDNRQQTEDMLRGFMDMAPGEPGYDQAQAFLTQYLEGFFGPPQQG